MTSTMESVRASRSTIIRSFVRTFLLRTPFLMLNLQFRKWFFMPMNYWRSIELPLVLAEIESSNEKPQRILDLSSPKLLAFIVASRFPSSKIVSTDISDYFIADTSKLKKAVKLHNLEFAIEDARQMTFPDEAFDLIYSISTVEHIPDDGDSAAVKDLFRVLAPGGRLLLTVPWAAEAVHEYVAPDYIYWSDFSTSAGEKVFYQRRYDANTLRERIIEAAPWADVRVTYMAEKPISGKQAATPDGKVTENIHTIGARFKSNIFLRTILKLQLPVPLAGYWYFRRYSDRCHYLTQDASDPNARGAYIEMVKPK